jgi:type IX secretion system PorP/SprF family membrane protein
MKKRNTNLYRYYLLALALCFVFSSNAQQYSATPVAQYYRNGYLWNPAYAGSKDHPSVYALLNNSWIGFDGAPVLGMISGDMAFGGHSGIGLKIISDKTGLLQRTVATLDYSFIVPLNASRRLRLGISAGSFSQRISQAGASGAADPMVMSFNSQKTLFDGSIGAVYEDKQFTLAAAVYNLRTGYFTKEASAQGNIPKLNVMASWSILVTGDDSTSIKPLVSYRAFSNGGGLFTAGIQLERNRLFNASLLWQDTGNLVGSVGLRIARLGEINVSYSGNNKYGYGQLYEIGLGVGLH